MESTLDSVDPVVEGWFQEKTDDQLSLACGSGLFSHQLRASLSFPSSRGRG
jgi:hypothetical protein